MWRKLSVRSGQAVLAGESAGAGPAIVCLHAGVCDKRMWRPLAELLAASFEVITYDRRGFGLTPVGDEAWSDVQDLCAVIEHCTPRAPVILIGASRGGALAIDLALAEPERVSALILIASAVSGAPDPEYPAELQPLLQQFEDAERAGDAERMNALEVHAWLDGPAMPEGRIEGPLRELLLDMNRIASSQPLPTARLEPSPAYPRLEALRVPVLVMAGSLDFPDRVALSQELAARIPRARLLMIEGAAHLPSLEQPERVAAALRAFLAEALEDA